MPRKRTVTAARTTTTTVTECVTATEEYPPVEWAPGWDPNRGYGGISAHDWREQRAKQVDRALGFLWLWAVSNKPGPEAMTAIWDAGLSGDLTAAAALVAAPESVQHDARVILRAGPAATPLEQHLGRSI